MNKEKLYYIEHVKDKKGLTIDDKTEILQVYKNGNLRIKGKRSISPGNWNRKRGMLVHHQQVKHYVEYYGFEGSYLEAVRAKGKEIKERPGEFLESLQIFIES